MCWTRAETAEFEGSETTVDDVQDTPLAVQLAAARAQITGMEQVNSLLNERLGMADAHSMELAKNLNITLGTVDRFTLALPAPTSTQGSTTQRRGLWPFRKKTVDSASVSRRDANVEPDSARGVSDWAALP